MRGVDPNDSIDATDAPPRTVPTRQRNKSIAALKEVVPPVPVAGPILAGLVGVLVVALIGLGAWWSSTRSIPAAGLASAAINDCLRRFANDLRVMPIGQEAVTAMGDGQYSVRLQHVIFGVDWTMICRWDSRPITQDCVPSCFHSASTADFQT